MLAGIFATKKRAACFATLRAEKRRRASRREPDQSGFAQLTDRRRQSQLRPPTLNGSKTTSGDSKQGGRFARSPCRTIRQTVTDWPEEPSPAMLPPPVTPCRCSRLSLLVMMATMMLGGRRRRVCRRCRHAGLCRRRCHARLSRGALGPGRKPASPSRWRRKLRRGLIGCASYSWISLIWAALNGSQ